MEEENRYREEEEQAMAAFFATGSFQNPLLYFGGKFNKTQAGLYHAPLAGVLIEPFAGLAGYVRDWPHLPLAALPP